MTDEQVVEILYECESAIIDADTIKEMAIAFIKLEDKEVLVITIPTNNAKLVSSIEQRIRVKITRLKKQAQDRHITVPFFKMFFAGTEEVDGRLKMRLQKHKPELHLKNDIDKIFS